TIVLNTPFRAWHSHINSKRAQLPWHNKEELMVSCPAMLKPLSGKSIYLSIYTLARQGIIPNIPTIINISIHELRVIVDYLRSCTLSRNLVATLSLQLYTCTNRLAEPLT